MMTADGMAMAVEHEPERVVRSGRPAVGWDEPPPPLLVLGVEQFNAGAYWECHETLETLWRQEARPVRDLYQGILQIGVGFLHGRRGNWPGAVKALRRGLARLDGLPEICQGVYVAELRRAGRAVLDRLLAAGADGLTERVLDSFPRVVIARSAEKPTSQA